MSQDPYNATLTLPNDVFHQQQPDIGIYNDYWEITTYCDMDDIDDGEERACCFICCFEFENGDSLLTLPCGDVFHLDCFDRRLRRRRRNDCPFCSAQVLPAYEQIEEEEEEEEEEFEDEEITEEEEEEDKTFEIETRTYYATVMEIDNNEEEEETCAICLCEYEDEDTIGKLQCGHEFHVGCVNKWLQQKNTCPFCRAQVLPARD